MITIEMANAYFTRHVDKSYWTGLSDDQKDGCLAMAEQDICLQLCIDSIDITSVFQCNAVYEQAVYLSRHWETLNVPDNIESESISGEGSREYRQSRQLIAPRANMFIRKLTGGICRISRG